MVVSPKLQSTHIQENQEATYVHEHAIIIIISNMIDKYVLKYLKYNSRSGWHRESRWPVISFVISTPNINLELHERSVRFSRVL